MDDAGKKRSGVMKPSQYRFKMECSISEELSARLKFLEHPIIISKVSRG
jgi:hypothetical protein